MRPLVLIIIVVLAVSGLILALPTPPQANETTPEPGRFVISGARVFDGQQFLEGVDVIVGNGQIEAVGKGLASSAGLPRIEAAGQTLLPGLIDAHTHSFGLAQADALRFGVTTMLDMFTIPSLLPDSRQQRQSRDQSRLADLYSAGVLATARGGHGTQYGISIPTVDAADQAEAWVDARIAEGSDFIKIVIEPGRLFGIQWPTLDEATVRALVTAAHARGLLALAHVSMEADALMAVEAGVDGLVHVFADRPASAEFLALAHARGVFVVPTTVVMAGVANYFDIDALLADNGAASRFSDEQRASLRGGGWNVPNGAAILERSRDNVRALHAAGIPLLAGSDAPNPGTAHGFSVHEELVFLVEAGMSAAEALHSATLLPAERFSLSGRGCIAPGCRADLLLVNGDPQADIRTTRQIAAVWKNGLPVRLDAALPEPTDAGARARAATDLLSPEEIGRWMASDDRFMNGRSQARIAGREDKQIQVEGELAAGFAFPYAGLMWSAGEPFMSPVDLRERSRLIVQVRGEGGPWMAMVFSGATPETSQSQQLPLRASGDGASLEADLSTLGGLDQSVFQAVGVFAIGAPREFYFELIEVRLE
ncbi:MAG: amidohydrolase family protein [Wenzhouxiangella sp.]